MLKTRVVGVLVVKNGWVVQSIQFKRFLPIGSVDIAVEYMDRWGIDEILILDISASSKQLPNFKMIESASAFSQTPLTVGGGITSLSDIESLLRAGADKISINSQLFLKPTLVSEGAYKFGSQCIVASIDAVHTKDEYRVYKRGIGRLNMLVTELAKIAEDSGAGEVFLNSVDKDGMKTGYDLNLYHEVRKSVSIPIILCGGVRRPSDLVEGAKNGANAVAASNFFHFTEMSVIAAKQFMLQHGCNVRLDSNVTYSDITFDQYTERIEKNAESVLEQLKFERVQDEVI